MGEKLQELVVVLGELLLTSQGEVEEEGRWSENKRDALATLGLRTGLAKGDGRGRAGSMGTRTR